MKLGWAHWYGIAWEGHLGELSNGFKDPEGNTTEVFWRSPRDCWVPTGDPVDLSQSDDVILAQVNAAADRSKDVPVGGVREQVAAPSGA